MCNMVIRCGAVAWNKCVSVKGEEDERKIASVRMNQRRSIKHIHKALTCLRSGFVDWSDSFPSLENA